MNNHQRIPSRTERLARSLTIPVAVAFLAWLIWSNDQHLISILSESDIVMLCTSILVLFFANASAGQIFAYIARRGNSENHSRIELIAAFLFSQIAKYVPGRVWSVFLQGAFFRHRISVPSLLFTNIETTLLTLGVTVGVGLAFLAWAIQGALSGVLLLATTILVLATLLWSGAGPRLARVPLRAIPRLAHRLEGLRPVVGSTSPTEAIIAIGVHTAAYSAGWFLFVWAALGHDVLSALALCASLSFAYVAGIVSMVPAGLGVREAVLIAIAPASSITPSQMAGVALISRGVMIMLDCLSIVVGALALKIQERIPPSVSDES